MLHATKTGISSVRVGLWLVCHTERNFSTLPFKSLNATIEGKFLADTQSKIWPAWYEQAPYPSKYLRGRINRLNFCTAIAKAWLHRFNLVRQFRMKRDSLWAGSSFVSSRKILAARPPKCFPNSRERACEQTRTIKERSVRSSFSAFCGTYLYSVLEVIHSRFHPNNISTGKEKLRFLKRICLRTTMDGWGNSFVL